MCGGPREYRGQRSNENQDEDEYPPRPGGAHNGINSLPSSINYRFAREGGDAGLHSG